MSNQISEKVTVEFTPGELNMNIEAVKYAREAFEDKLRNLEVKYNKTTMLETLKQLKVKDEIYMVEVTIRKYLDIEKKLNGVMIA